MNETPESPHETTEFPHEDLVLFEQFKEQVTGAPLGIYYRVEDPSTGLSYQFDHFANGQLIWLVASYRRLVADFHGAGASGFEDMEVPIDEAAIEQMYIDAAKLQAAVAQGHPVVWVVKDAADATILSDVLARAGITGVGVGPTNTQDPA